VTAVVLGLLAAPFRAAIRWLEESPRAARSANAKGRRTPSRAEAVAARRKRRAVAERARRG